MTRLEVVNQILGLLRRSDCSATLAATFLDQGIARVERQLRTPSMERVAHVTAANTMHSMTIPEDLLQVIDVVANGRPLDKISHRELIARARCAGVGCPHVYSRFGTGIYFAPFLATGGDVSLAYYGALDALNADPDTNAGTREFPDLLTYAALGFAGRYFRHDETQNWDDLYDQLLSETQDQATQTDATGGSEVVLSAYGEC